MQYRKVFANAVVGEARIPPALAVGSVKFAMVKCGELPCTISNVAKNLHKSVSSISTTRAQQIRKGIIYPVRYKELDFTVPEFSGFIQRLDEYKQWDEN